MWEFYLSISESAFRRFGHSVFQIQLAKRIDVVPITRDFIAAAENEVTAAAREFLGRGRQPVPSGSCEFVRSSTTTAAPSA